MTIKKKNPKEKNRYAWSKFQQSPDPSELPIPYGLLNIQKKNENEKENIQNLKINK